MIQPRPATAADVEMLARLHVCCWQECYTGLLPAEEIARHDLSLRRSQWERQIGGGQTRISVVDGLGFAQVGPQREPALAAQGFAEELYALYARAASHGSGLGLALFQAALGPRPAPLTAVVLDANARACAFYAKTGGVVLETRDDISGSVPIAERVYGWRAPGAGLTLRPPRPPTSPEEG